MGGFFQSEGGNVAIITAFAIMALAGLAAVSVHFSAATGEKNRLQQIADNAALSAAAEMAITRNNAEAIRQVALNYVAAAELGARARYDAVVDIDASTVTVDISAAAPEAFGRRDLIVAVDATAKLMGEAGNVCMIGLSPDASRTLRMNTRARITAADCAIYSNSTSNQSMSVDGNARVTANFVCLAGGYQGNPNVISTPAIEDCPAIADPLAGRAAPLFGTDCDYTDLAVIDRDTLMPGVYCGGLHVQGGEVNLTPGVYVMKDGPLIVDEYGELQGLNVGFYLTGEGAFIDFEVDSVIELTAPPTGPMTGLLFYADPTISLASAGSDGGDHGRGGAARTAHIIRSDDARRMVGTIYLPGGRLIIDGEQPVADRSEYTVILAETFELNNGPNLVLRTDYHLSDIPVPDGLGPLADPNVQLID